MKYFAILPDMFANVGLLCADNDGGGQSQEGPQESDQPVRQEPGEQETVLVFVPQPQLLSPGGGKGKEGGVFPQARQAQCVEESKQYKHNTCNQKCLETIF